MAKNGRTKKSGKGRGKDGRPARDAERTGKTETLPRALVPAEDAPVMTLPHGRFDLEDPELPGWLRKRAFGSGGYPYDGPLDDDSYDAELEALQIELVKLQKWVATTGQRLVVLFEGRDAAGKGSSIFVFARYLNPRGARIVALPKPTETERGQWYFQRYVDRLPTAGEIVLFDRSWYNRGVVEPVMGFCTPEQTRVFLQQAPAFEKLLVEQGLTLFKFWLDIGREMQLLRFHERRHSPLKIWKLSPLDYVAMTKWEEFGTARDRMLDATHKADTPWTVVLANDKKRARLALIRAVLGRFDYDGKDADVVGEPDPAILGSGPDFLQSAASSRSRRAAR